MTTPVHILGISGSLRKNSINTELLHVAAAKLPDHVTFEIFDLKDIPLYNGDIDGPDAPAAVKELKARIAAADAVLIASPEYNWSITGVLKNAIDWASRPMKETPLNGKPVAIMGAGGVFGTIRGQIHLRQILSALNMQVLAKPDVAVTRAWEKFDEHGKLHDEASREQVHALVAALADWTRRLRGN